jgi:hypothetical protein
MRRHRLLLGKSGLHFCFGNQFDLVQALLLHSEADAFAK